MINDNLKRVLLSAANTVPYYNNLFIENNINLDNAPVSEILNITPITSKETIKQFGWVNFINFNYLDKDNNLVEQGTRIESTSGTTGEPIHVAWDAKEYFMSTLSHWKFRKDCAGILPTDKVCRSNFNRRSLTPFTKNSLNIKLNSYFMKEESIISFLRETVLFKAKWLYISAGILYMLINIAKRENIPFGETIEYIELTTEPVLPVYREAIEEYFGMKAYDMYGCAETNGIAMECFYGKRHVMSDNVIVEILRDGVNVGYNSLGNVCVTGLQNTVMPMIRYLLNDKAVLTESHCPCGNHSPVIELSSTRIPEVLILNSPHTYNEAYLYYPIHHLGFVKCSDEDIHFSMQLQSINKYNVVFACEDHSRLNEYKLLFLNIIYAYKLQKINFNFSISDELDVRFLSGIIKRL